MKRSILAFTFLFIICLSAISQTDLKFFDSKLNELSGFNKIGEGHLKAIKGMEFNFEYEKEIVTEFSQMEFDLGKNITVYFKPLTKEPIFSFGNDLDEIKEFIKSYSLTTFFNSYKLESLLDKSIENIKKNKPVLTLAYFLINMPINPDNKTSTNLAGQKVIRLDYNFINLSLFFKDEVLISYSKE